MMMTHIYTHPMAHKIAVVTGSSKGIGKAIVIAFAKSNKYSGIVINARKIEEAQNVSDEINRMGCESVAVEADISKESDC
jgi:NAD(P)-dependent dehydrogenase (short-subunit alcohol dehydrogenase family)